MESKEADTDQGIQDIYEIGVNQLPSDENASDEAFGNFMLDIVDANDEPAENSD